MSQVEGSRSNLKAPGAKWRRWEVPGAKLEAQFVPKEFGFPIFQLHEWQESNSVFFSKIKNTFQTCSIMADDMGRSP